MRWRCADLDRLRDAVPVRLRRVAGAGDARSVDVPSVRHPPRRHPPAHAPPLPLCRPLQHPPRAPHAAERAHPDKRRHLLHPRRQHRAHLSPPGRRGGVDPDPLLGGHGGEHVREDVRAVDAEAAVVEEEEPGGVCGGGGDGVGYRVGVLGRDRGRVVGARGEGVGRDGGVWGVRGSGQRIGRVARFRTG